MTRRPTSPPESPVVQVRANFEAAEAEAARLNRVNADKAVRYWAQHTRYVSETDTGSSRPECPVGPVTIVAARYGGIYEPGAWLAFPSSPESLPPDWNAGDVACSAFFAERSHEIGGGESPDEAYDDLLRKQAARRND